MATERSRIYVLGGLNFLGRRVCARLARAGHEVFVLPPDCATGARSRSSGLSRIGPRSGLWTTRAVGAPLDDADLVVMLTTRAGSQRPVRHDGLAGRGDGADASRLVLAVGPPRIVAAAREGDFAQQARNDCTIFEPGPIFGPEDELTTPLARWILRTPVLMLPRRQMRFAPVYVGDVAAAICAAIDDPTSLGQHIQLAGPESYSLRSLVDYLRSALGVSRAVVELPKGHWLETRLGMPAAARAAIDSARTAATASGADGLTALGIEPRALSSVLAEYLTP
jgi:nucleoside-diphosphate-sugar epimerase